MPHRSQDAMYGALDVANKVDQLSKELVEVSNRLRAIARGLSDISWLRLEIDELELSVRSFNCLKREGITHVWQLLQYSRKDLKQIANMGPKSINEVAEVLQNIGFSLRGEHSRPNALLPERKDWQMMDTGGLAK